MTVRDVLITMEKIGFTDVVLPFILVFTVIFAVLQKSKILGSHNGKPKANYNSMVALVIAFFVLVMVNTVEIITWLTRYVAVLMIAFFFLALVFAFLGVKERHKNVLMFIALMLLTFVFLQVAAFTGIMDPLFVEEFILPIFVVIFLIGLVALMFRTPPEKAKPGKHTDKIPGLVKEDVIKKKLEEKKDRSKA